MLYTVSHGKETSEGADTQISLFSYIAIWCQKQLEKKITIFHQNTAFYLLEFRLHDSKDNVSFAHCFAPRRYLIIIWYSIKILVWHIYQDLTIKHSSKDYENTESSPHQPEERMKSNKNAFPGQCRLLLVLMSMTLYSDF